METYTLQKLYQEIARDNPNRSIYENVMEALSLWYSDFDALESQRTDTLIRGTIKRLHLK